MLIKQVLLVVARNSEADYSVGERVSTGVLATLEGAMPDFVPAKLAELNAFGFDEFPNIYHTLGFRRGRTAKVGDIKIMLSGEFDASFKRAYGMVIESSASKGLYGLWDVSELKLQKDDK